MKVSDLLASLSGIDPDIEVVIANGLWWHEARTAFLEKANEVVGPKSDTFVVMVQQ